MLAAVVVIAVVLTVTIPTATGVIAPDAVRDTMNTGGSMFGTSDYDPHEMAIDVEIHRWSADEHAGLEYGSAMARVWFEHVVQPAVAHTLKIVNPGRFLHGGFSLLVAWLDALSFEFLCFAGLGVGAIVVYCCLQQMRETGSSSQYKKDA